MVTATKKKRQPAAIDESEVATGATVTTSTVKHDVAAKNTVPEDDVEEENGNHGDPIHDPEANKKLDALSEEASPLIKVEIASEAENDDSDKNDPHTAELTEAGKKMLEECASRSTNCCVVSSKLRPSKEGKLSPPFVTPGEKISVQIGP
jgi:hypothetical protein